MKKRRYEKLFLDELSLAPVPSFVCKKIGLSRNTVYRWRMEDPDFAAKMDKAMRMGTRSINDICELGLIKKVQEGDLRAIKYWLDNNKKNYARPRPINFWNNASPERKISGFRVHIIESKEDLERYNEIIEFKKKYGDKVKLEDDSFPIDNY
jgi:hypothetical protein